MRPLHVRILAGLALLLTATALAFVDRGNDVSSGGARSRLAATSDAPSMEREPEGTAPPAWAQAVEAGDDHLPAAELTHRLLDAPDSLLIVDVRPADEFAAFHLPGSRNLDLSRLLGPEGSALLDADPTRLVVLVSNGMTHPAQAWVELASRGRTNVRVLEDGIDGFRAAFLTPPSLRGPTTKRRALEDGRIFRELSARVFARPTAPAPSASPKGDGP